MATRNGKDEITMSEKHTEGKCRVAFGSEITMSRPGIVEGDKRIADCANPLKPKEEVDANARRLVAAWNTCDGIPTEALEAVVGEMREALETCVAALFAGMGISPCPDDQLPDNFLGKAIRDARAVLARKDGPCIAPLE